MREGCSSVMSATWSKVTLRSGTDILANMELNYVNNSEAIGEYPDNVLNVQDI